uniref:Uncharacterized protein n=1 Tax=Arundo donax TaxID=35708 RepID=A0A0A9BL31_ARUDO
MIPQASATTELPMHSPEHLPLPLLFMTESRASLYTQAL